MTTEYKCPYCGQDSYAKKSKKQGKYISWKAVRAHTSKCNKNTGEYYTDINYGPIIYTEFLQQDKIIRNKYPLLLDISNITKSFKNRNIVTQDTHYFWTKKLIIDSIIKFYEINNRIPQTRDFENNINYPSVKPIVKYFGSWNAAIAAAGFTPNLNDGFGNRITALDGVLYRSWYETEFVNKWLFNKEKYFYEVKYPNDNKFYDFYLPEKDLYIEIDGGLRPQVMEEKIAINKQLGRKLLVIKTSEIESFKGLLCI